METETASQRHPRETHNTCTHDCFQKSRRSPNKLCQTQHHLIRLSDSPLSALCQPLYVVDHENKKSAQAQKQICMQFGRVPLNTCCARKNSGTCDRAHTANLCKKHMCRHPETETHTHTHARARARTNNVSMTYSHHACIHKFALLSPNLPPPPPRTFHKIPQTERRAQDN